MNPTQRNWLEPMLAEAAKRGLDMGSLRSAATYLWDHGVEFDWLDFGLKLRRELGWDHVYPRLPVHMELKGS